MIFQEYQKIPRLLPLLNLITSVDSLPAVCTSMITVDYCNKKFNDC